LLDLRAALDEVEDALEWPGLLAEAEERLKNLREVVEQYGDSTQKQTAGAMERETRDAMQTRDADMLRRKIAETNSLAIRVLREQPGFWVGWLRYLEERKATMRDSSQAELLIGQGNRAINGNDLPGLKAAVQQLIGLLPADQQEEVRKGFGSTVL